MLANPFLSVICDRIVLEPERLFAEIWVGDERRCLSWGELGRRASSYAGLYRRSGAATGDVVFIILKHCADLYPAFLGAMLAGCVPSFLPFPSVKQDPKLYWSSHIAVFERSGAKLLLTSGEIADQLDGAIRDLLPVLTAADLDAKSFGRDEFLPGPAEDCVALLQHSSGTTGLKKGVALSYRAIRLQIEAYRQALGVGQSSGAIASWLPLYHDMGLIASFLMPMYLGLPIVSLDAFEWTARPALLFDAIESMLATHVWLPNFALAHLTRTVPHTRRYDLSSLVAIIGCSEPNRVQTFESFLARFAVDGIERRHLHTCYAMAETVFAVSQSRLEQEPRRLSVEIKRGKVEPSSGAGSTDLISNGPPIPGMALAVLHDGELCDGAIAGELCVRAPYLFSGYFADTETTNDSFHEGWFKTGDLGFLWDGEVYVFGRSKDLIIVNGRKFYAHDIEAIANEASGIKKGRCVVFGIHVPAIGSEQIVVVAERDAEVCDDGVTTSAINSALNRRLGIPAGDVCLVDPGWLVKTTSGKISRAENVLKYVRLFRPEVQALYIGEAGA